MLYGYSIVQGIVNAQGKSQSASGRALYSSAPFTAGCNSRARFGEAALAFPPRYGGGFGPRAGVTGQPDLEWHCALGEPARSMLERELGREAAQRMIHVVERMAAAAADPEQDGFHPPSR